VVQRGNGVAGALAETPALRAPHTSAMMMSRRSRTDANCDSTAGEPAGRRSAPPEQRAQRRLRCARGRRDGRTEQPHGEREPGSMAAPCAHAQES
jgi:hypothetical protein